MLVTQSTSDLYAAGLSKRDSLTPCCSVKELSHIFSVLDFFTSPYIKVIVPLALQQKLWGVFGFGSASRHVFTLLLNRGIVVRNPVALMQPESQLSFGAPLFMLTFVGAAFSICEVH